MLKIKTNFLFTYLILGLVLLVYLFPGFFQFFIGIPSTAYALGLTCAIYLIVVLDIVIRNKVIVTTSILIFLLLAGLIIISGVANSTSPIKVLLYLNFAFIPLATIYLTKIIRKRQLLIQKSLSQVLRFVVIIQLPIILIQKFFYDFFIRFSNANQAIAEVDFMFGTFSLKADHALGFFLIVYLLHLIIKMRSTKLKSFKAYFMLMYLVVTILVMESNLTKLVLLLIIAYYFSIWVYKKVNIFGGVLIVLFVILLYNFAMSFYVIKSQIDHLTSTLNDDYVVKSVERGYAKRPHVVLYQLKHEKFKLLGNGPYDYFDITTGEFKNTIHFSQIIWFYNDVGMISLIISLIALLIVIKNLDLNKESKLLVIAVMLLYLFMTNVLGDIAMMLSLILLNNKLKFNHNYNETT